MFRDVHLFGDIFGFSSTSDNLNISLSTRKKKTLLKSYFIIQKSCEAQPESNVDVADNTLEPTPKKTR